MRSSLWPRPVTLPRPAFRPEFVVPVNEDCRHYVMRIHPGGERLERCKVDANEPLPFACPDGCLFYEPRKVSQAGWRVPVPTRTVEPGPASPPA